MGICYYAYPIAAELVAQAHGDPYLFMSDDPLMDAWGPSDQRPPMLYLDKCWRYLQHLTWPPDEEPRPSYRLVEGNVTYVMDQYCWDAWIRVIDPHEADEIARDIVLFDDGDIRRVPILRPASEADEFEEYDYIKHYLSEAQEFVVQLAREGSGLVYLIG